MAAVAKKRPGNTRQTPKVTDNPLMSFVVPTLLIGVVIIMIIPIPPLLLDILLSFNISLSLVILFVSLYLGRPLEFSSYPSLILMTTLFRLAMNISTTRLILLHGNSGPDAAGSVIKAFGTFVLGGNYAIGVVIFIIITMINFSVITKGSGRIAEVAARFTLDAMPGKQMAIDSDLNSGLITEADAKQMRKDLSAEAEFYGSMDGASKFVRGDAVAGIMITMVNIAGGFFVGIIQGGMDWKRAAETYTLLSIGDGLVAQIPALIVSTSAGLIVARAASGADLGSEVSWQLTKNSRPLFLTSGVSAFFSLVPGLPFFPFMILAASTLVMGLNSRKKEPTAEAKEAEAATGLAMSGGQTNLPPPPGSTEEVKKLLGVDLLELEVGYELVPLVESSTGGELIERIRSLRRQFAVDLGFIVPPIHIRDNVRLQPNQYRLMLKGNPIATGTIMRHNFLAMDPGGIETKIPGIPTKEPAFGLDALWINAADKERAQMAGYTVVDPTTVITTHVTELIKSHAHEILGRSEVQVLLDNLSAEHPKLVEEVVPTVLTLGTIQQVLSSLLRENVSIRDLRTVMETLADWGPAVKSPERLTDHVRRALARSITAKHVAENGILSLVSLAPTTERILSDSLQISDTGSFLAIEPSVAQKLIAQLKAAAERFAQTGTSPILLAPATIRAALFSFTERFIPGFTILSHQEILPSTKVQSLGVVGIDR
jgi:flagellar biosynthesis protein FlhA